LLPKGVQKNENEISKIIIESALEAHKTLGGPGLLESVYQEALLYEMAARQLVVGREVKVPLQYKGRNLRTYLQIDLLVNRLVVVECKSISHILPIHLSQTLTYLRLADKKN